MPRIDCACESILRRYDTTDLVHGASPRPSTRRPRPVAHEADLYDERFDVPEAHGIDIALRALSVVCDAEQIPHRAIVRRSRRVLPRHPARP
jgi:hypothetical protein